MLSEASYHNMTVGRIPSVEGGIQPTIVDAKGDLIAAVAADSLNRLAVGSNDQVLVADSAASTGLAWKSYGAQFVAGKNKIINGDYGVWQRGTTLSVTTNFAAYLADRFLLNFAGTFTGTLSQQTFTPGTAPVAGYEGRFFQRIVRTGTTSVSPTYYQKVEDVRTLAGQTATFSFWAKADAARSVGIQAYQDFGTGGSSPTDTTVGTASLTTSWQRFTFTHTMPSVSGKTISTSNDSWMTFYMTLPNSVAFTIDIWGVQLEAGSVATPFTTATGTIQGELAACQRYYFRQNASSNAGDYTAFAQGWASTTTNVNVLVKTPVTMRVKPTSIEYSTLMVGEGNTAISVTNLTIGANASPDLIGMPATVSGATQYRPYYLGANNSTSAYVAVSAEL
jgi:hypothetical protein